MFELAIAFSLPFSILHVSEAAHIASELYSSEK